MTPRPSDIEEEEFEDSGVDALQGAGGEPSGPLREMLGELIGYVTKVELELEDASEAEFRAIAGRLRRLKAMVAALPEQAQARTALGFQMKE